MDETKKGYRQEAEVRNKETGVEKARNPERETARRAADAIATVASGNLSRLRELGGDESLSPIDRLVIQTTVFNLMKAREIAYGISENDARARYEYPGSERDSKSEVEEVVRRRIELKLSD